MCSWRAQYQLLAVTACTLALVAAEDTCHGPVVRLGVTNGTSPASTFYGVLAGFGGIPSKDWTPAVQLAVAEPIQACQDIKPVAGAVVLVERGNCSFVRKYESVVAAGAKGMLLFNSQPGCISMGGNASNVTNSSLPSEQVPPAISLDRSTAQQLLGWLRDTSLTVSLQLVELSPLDGSAAVLWLMAVGTLVAGSIWSGWDHQVERKAAQAAGSSGAAPAGGSAGGPAGEVLDITAAGAVAFVCVASLMLLLLFFFMSEAFFVFIMVMFCLAGAQALTLLLQLPVHLYCPGLMGRGVNLPCVGWVPAETLLAAPVAVAVAVVFGVYRHASWSWLLQDLMGIALMISIQRVLRLGSMRVACVLLPLCFFYDIFWVFLQPLIWHTESSVMVTVAEGASVNEFLPMLLRVPRFSAPPIVREYSLLGFGDVILPGLLAGLTRRLDIDAKRTWYKGYFAPCVAGYGAGLLLTYAALMFSWFGDEGQPALLYLTPCTLGLVLVLGAVRGEWQQLFVCAEAAGQEVGDSHGDEDVWDDGDPEEAQDADTQASDPECGRPSGQWRSAGSAVQDRGDSSEEHRRLLGPRAARRS